MSQKSTERAVLTASTEQRAQQLAGLRELVDWLTEHPEVPLSNVAPNIQVNTGARVSDEAGLRLVDAAADVMGVRTEPTASGFVAEKTFSGGVRYFVIHILGEHMERHTALHSNPLRRPAEVA